MFFLLVHCSPWCSTSNKLMCILGEDCKPLPTQVSQNKKHTLTTNSLYKPTIKDPTWFSLSSPPFFYFTVAAMKPLGTNILRYSTEHLQRTHPRKLQVSSKPTAQVLTSWQNGGMGKTFLYIIFVFYQQGETKTSKTPIKRSNILKNLSRLSQLLLI